MVDQNRNEDQNHEGDSSTAATAGTDVPNGIITRGENNNVIRKDSLMLKAIYKNFSF